MKTLVAIEQSRHAPAADRAELERVVRRRALAWVRASRDRTREQAARSLCLCSRTVREWDGRWRTDRLEAAARGRPGEATSREERVRMVGLLWVLGPDAGYETVKPYFLHASRRELRRLLHRTRRLWKRLSKRGALALRWCVTGTVWAADFTDAPSPIEGRYRRILIVRDLASGETLLALPCEDETSQTAADAVRALFRQLGPPLVMKVDNGSHFTGAPFLDVLAEHGVTALFSPPYWPAYNGACEAGVGSIKTRAHRLSARAGRAGDWTLTDVEGARLEANETGRPLGASQPTPDERWTLRREIGRDERDLFRQAVERHVAEERRRRGVDCEREPSKDELASLRRAGIAGALAELGCLEFRTRWVSPPIASFLSAIIS